MKNISLLIILSLILTSCARTYQYAKTANSNEKEMATIYVVRPSWFGSAIKFKIYQDEALVGKLGPKSYLAWNVKPGGNALSIMSKSENKAIVKINPQPGKTYYLKQKVKMGIIIARSDMELIEEQQGKEMLRKLKTPKSKRAK